MMANPDEKGSLQEIQRLRERLAAAEEVLTAIRKGEVDALVVNTSKGDQIFTLRNAERPYRIMVEEMNEGAFTISTDGTILYSNQSFASMVKSPPNRLLLAGIDKYIAPESKAHFEALRGQDGRGEIVLLTAENKRVRTQFALRKLALDEDMNVLCGVVSDLTQEAGLRIEREKLAMKLLEVEEKERRLARKQAEVRATRDTVEELRQRLEEAEQTVDAIRSGEVDALVVNTDKGDQVFTLKSPERHYRIIVEQMNAGALTLSIEGHILYCNQCFAQMVKSPLEQILGGSILDYLASESRARYASLAKGAHRVKINLVASDKTELATLFALNTLNLEGGVVVYCAVVTDLTREEPQHQERS
jgi:PAS domain-containing protein